MTRQRFDGHGTEFGQWLRDQPEINSALGFLATNIDFMWHNHKTGKWILIEEKRHGSDIKKWQKDMFTILHKAAKCCPGYNGIAFLQFENTSPLDGKIYWNRKEISKEELIHKLKSVTT